MTGILRSISLLTVSVAPLLLATAVSAGVADLKADWSDTVNPNPASYGTWRLNQGNTLLSDVNSWTLIPGVDGWGPAANVTSNSTPFFFKTKSAGLTNNTTGIGPDYQVGDVVMHAQDIYTGPGNTQGNVTWTSPGADTVSVSGVLWPTRIFFQRENKYSLVLNPAGSNTVLASGFILEDGSVSRATPLTFNIPSLVIQPGDVLRLQIERSGRVTGIQADAADFTGFNITISSVPEPSSLFLLVSAAGTLLLRRKRP